MSEPSSPKILVVDDEPRNIRILQIQLTAKGYTVLTATNGQEALEMVKTASPDLILLDIMMPKMNGFEVCEQIRADESTQFLPVVMVTALSDTQDRIRAIELGADDFISKPFDSLEILARVRSLVRIKQYQDALRQHNERLDEELEMAREVQESLMPQGITDLSGFRIVSHYTPEMAVGGDFFDLWEIEPGRLGVFISDVMGHGVSAAFGTVLIKTLVEEMKTQTDDPAHLLETLNARFSNLIGSQFMFATALCAVLDLPNEKIRCANAGHPFPFLMWRRRNVCEPIANQCIGTGLGLLSDPTYETVDYPFDPLGGLFLYTDGAYEFQNSQGEAFNPERLQNVITQQVSQPAPVLVERVVEAINQFSNGHPKDDDITIVAIDVKEKG
ncbi:MAG: response regulator [Candidatus Poribacteria bacterium]|nr:response regulator [Candidatus Poribacteria bacterium]